MRAGQLDPRRSILSGLFVFIFLFAGPAHATDYSPVRIYDATTPLYFQKIAGAFDCPSLSDGDAICLLNGSFNENLVFDRDVSVLVKGGFDADFENSSGSTEINGSLIVQNGGLTVEKLILSRSVVENEFPAPVITSFQIAPETIDAGESVTLSWETGNADQVVIDNGIGTVGVSGRWTTAPGSGETFTLIATGPGGTVSKTASVAVKTPAPTAFLAVYPYEIEAGQNVVVYWSSTEANDCEIDPLGVVDCDGFQVVSPSGNATFVLTADGPGGRATDQGTVTVNEAPVALTLSGCPEGDITDFNGVQLIATLDYPTSPDRDVTLYTKGTSYESSDTRIAKVSQTGVLTPVSDGAALITAKNGTLSATCSTIVDLDDTEVTRLNVTPWNPSISSEGGTRQLTVWGTRADGAVTDVTASAEYTSFNEAVATVSGTGTVTAVGNGVVQIQVEYNGVKLTAPVTVQIAGDPSSDAFSGYVNGRVVDSDGSPIESATITMDGVVGIIETDADGKFAFPTPEGARQFRITAEKDGYTYAHRTGGVFSGHDTVVDDMVLTLLDSARTVIADNSVETIHTSSDGTVQLIVPPYASSVGVSLGATNLDDYAQIPALPDTSVFTYCVKLEPDLAMFDRPVTIRVKNSLNFPAGSRIPAGRYSRDTGRWEHIGMAAVTGDGLWVEAQTDRFSAADINSIEGVLEPLRKKINRLHSQDNTPAEDFDTNELCAGVSGSSLIAQMSGNLLEKHSLPAYRSRSVPKSVGLSYNSDRARPRFPLVMEAPADATDTESIQKVKAVFNVEGIKEEFYFSPDPETARFGWFWDVVNGRNGSPGTGVYPYSIELYYYFDAVYWIQEFFGGTRRAPTAIPSRIKEYVLKKREGNALIVDFSDSPYGAGWGIDGLQKLTVGYTAVKPMIHDGGGKATAFFPRTFLITRDVEYPGGVSAGNSPPHVVSDGKAGFYISNPDANVVLYVDETGKARIIAGDEYGTAGNTGDGGPAAEALLDNPGKLLLDSMGNLYICDRGNNRVRRVGTNGVIVDIAGNGSIDADGVPAENVSLSNPSALAMDKRGNLYIAEQGAHRVRMIGLDGLIETVAGTGTSGFSGDGGLAVEALLNEPDALAVDGLGRLCIGDSENHRVRRINSDDTIETVAGNGENNSNGNGRPAVDAAIRPVADIAFAMDGSMILLTKYSYTRCRIVTPDGKIDELINVNDEYPEDSGQSISVGPEGNLYLGARAGGGYSSASHQILEIHAGGVPLGEWTIHSAAGDFSTLSRKGDGTYERRYNDGNIVYFDSDGFETAVADRNGNTTSFTYTDFGAVETIVDPAGKTVLFSYENQKLHRIADPSGRITGFEVDIDGDLVQITNPDSSTRQFQYDAQHRMTGQIDAGGAETEYRYDSLGGVETVVYDDDSRRTIKSEYSQGMANLLSGDSGTESNPAPPFLVSQIENSFTDASGKKHTYEINRFGIRTRFLNDLKQETNIERSEDNLPARVESPGGRIHEIDYNEYGLPVVFRDAVAGTQVAIDYKNDFANAPDLVLPEQIENPMGEISNYSYDANGNITRIADAAGKNWDFAYDPACPGLLKTVANPEGETYTFAYNADCNILSASNHLNQTYSYEYDSYGNLTKTTNPEGDETAYEYDAMNRVIHKTDPLNNISTFEWDPAFGTDTSIGAAPLSVLKSYTDNRGKTTAYEYDSLYRLATVTDHTGRQVEYTYDQAGRPISRTDKKGMVTQYEYDAVGRLAKTTHDGGDAVVRTYEPDGYLREIFEQDNGIVFDYDALGRKIGSRFWADGGIPDHIMRFEYDALHRRTSMADSRGLRVDYAFGPANLLTSISGGPSLDVNFEYDGARRRIKRQYPNGIFRDIVYDDAGRMTSIDIRNASGSIHEIAYGYDDAGRSNSMTDIEGAHGYTFDDKGQLKTATHPNPGVNPDESYDYDAIGNRTSSHLSAMYTVDDLNRLTEDDQYAYDYDDSGAMTSRTAKTGGAVATYEYDSRDRLTVVTGEDGVTTAYEYDALDRRISSSVDGVVQARYRYDDFDRILEMDPDGNAAARFVFDSGIDRPLIMLRDDEPYFYHEDKLKSVRMISGETGTIAARYEYDSFGRLVASSETVENPYLFTGRPLDPVTGLYYFRAREYDPSLGRFLSPDLPVFARSGNLYVYAENKPLDFTDPVGYFLIGIGLEGSALWAPFLSGASKSVGGGFVFGSQGSSLCASYYETGALYAGIGEGGAASGSVVLHVSPFGDIEHFNGRSHNIMITGKFIDGASLNFAYPDLGPDATTWEQTKAALNGTISFSVGIGPGAAGAAMYGQSDTTVSEINPPKFNQQVTREMFTP